MALFSVLRFVVVSPRDSAEILRFYHCTVGLDAAPDCAHVAFNLLCFSLRVVKTALLCKTFVCAFHSMHHVILSVQLYV